MQIVRLISSKTSWHSIRSEIILVINKSDSRCAFVRFCHHSYDYSPSWTPLSPITITYPQLRSRLVEELEGLSLKLGENWKKLGRRLGFDEAAIINFDHGNRKLADKAFEMLLAWKQREGLNAFHEVLYDALCHNFVQCKLLAEEFCCDKIIENVSP